MRPTVFLFDIDGTLISSGGAARRAIERAFSERYGSSESLPASFGGMTDRAIVRDGLSLLRPELTRDALEAEIDAALEAYLRVLEETVLADPSSFLVQPGIHPVLDRLQSEPWCGVGLGTGNVRRGAQLKLDCVGLMDFFGFGGFGCDHIDRPRLLAVGAERGAGQLGAPLSACRVVVIGDTPKDVAAAHAIGAECIAVATGASTPNELRASGARAVFDDLTDPRALAHLLSA